MENAPRSAVRLPQLIAESAHGKATEQERLLFFSHVCDLKASECFESLSRLGSPWMPPPRFRFRKMQSCRRDAPRFLV
jgi:hypothetical protein